MEILKKSLAKLQQQIRDRKAMIEGKLKARQPISDSDEEWLDNGGNLVDEEWVVDALDNVLDYEWGFERLNSYDKLVVKKLKNLARSGAATTKKHKHMGFLVN